MVDSTVNEVIGAWRNAPLTATTARCDPTRLKDCYDRCCRHALEYLKSGLRREGYAEESIDVHVTECSERLKDRYGVVVGLMASSTMPTYMAGGVGAGGGGLKGEGQAAIKFAAAATAQLVYRIRSDMGAGRGEVGAPSRQGSMVWIEGGGGGRIVGRGKWRRGDAEVMREARRGASLRSREQRWGGVKLVSARSALRALHLFDGERPLGGAVLGGGYGGVHGRGGKEDLAKVNRFMGDAAKAERIRAAGELPIHSNDIKGLQIASLQLFEGCVEGFNEVGG